LTGANELVVVLVNEKEGKDGEQVGEYELQRDDGGGISEEVQPIFVWRRWRFAMIRIVEGSYPVWIVITTVTTDPKVILSLQ
jgi:hypothetical protein